MPVLAQSSGARRHVDGVEADATIRSEGAVKSDLRRKRQDDLGESRVEEKSINREGDKHAHGDEGVLYDSGPVRVAEPIRSERVSTRDAIQPPLPQVDLDRARTICRTVVQTHGGEAHKRVSAALELLLAYDEGLDHDLEIRKTKKALAQGVDVFIFDERHDWEFVGGHEVRTNSFTQSKIVVADGQDARGVAQVTLVKSQGRFTGRVGWAYALVQRVHGEEDEFEFVSPVLLFIVRD